jgi:GDP-4-dehydro-6-deoxy-D-mannose reductase
MKRVVVTGCGGFVGPYVTSVLAARGYEVWGVDVKEDVDDPSISRYVSCDLIDRAAVDALMGTVAPQAIVHLAAQSSAGKSLSEPFATLTRNILPVLNVLEFGRTAGKGVRILAVGSGDVYGAAAPEDLPLAETHPLRPANPYALSKAIQEQVCAHYAGCYGVDVVMTRSFNHTGAGQRDVFVLPSFARQVTEIKLGLREPRIDVGDLDLKRDFTDVRDVAEAYAVLLEKGARGEIYNVCSGVSYGLRALLEKMCAAARVAPEIRVEQTRIRPVEARDVRGDPAKIERDTGWRARTPIEATLESLLDDWKGRLTGAGQPGA